MIRYRWAVLGVWSVVLAVSLVAMSGLADLLTNRFTLPGTDTARAERILEDHFGQKTTGSFTVVVRGEPGSARELVGPVQEAAARASAVLPTSEVVSVQPVSDTVVTAQIVSNLGPADAKGYTDEMRVAVGEIPGAEAYVSGQAAIEHDLDPVFARGPEGRRVLHRHSDRAPHPRLRLRDARLPAPVRLRGRGHSDDARDHLDLRPLHGADDLPAEPRHADRVRDRDRLLAPRRLPLSRGAREGGLEGGRDRQDDGDGRPRGGLLRLRRRDRPRAHALHAAAVHARLRHRRPGDPARLDRLRADAPARPPLLHGRAARRGTPDPEARRRAPGRRGPEHVGAALADDHAAAGPCRGDHDRLPRPAGPAGADPGAGAGLERGHPAGPRGDQGPEHRLRGARRRRARADRDRDRHGRGRRRGGPGRAGRGRAPARRAGRRSRGLRDRLRPGEPAERRPVGTLPPRPGDRRERVRGAERARLRRPAARRDRPGSRLPGGGRGLRGRRPAQRRRLPRPHLRRLPLARARRAAPDLPAAPAGVPLAADPAQGDPAQPALDRARPTASWSCSSSGAPPSGSG